MYVMSLLENSQGAKRFSPFSTSRLEESSGRPLIHKEEMQALLVVHLNLRRAVPVGPPGRPTSTIANEVPESECYCLQQPLSAQ
jgi:hypothetical protein